MPDALSQRIAGISAKAQVLVQRYNLARRQLEDSRQTVSELTEKLADSRAIISRLESEVKYLQNSAALAPAASDVQKTRLMISELVREIDKCIRDLSDSPTH